MVHAAEAIKLREVIADLNRVQAESQVFHTSEGNWSPDAIEFTPLHEGTPCGERTSLSLPQPLRDDLFRRIGLPVGQLEGRLSAATRERVFQELFNDTLTSPTATRKLPVKLRVVSIDGEPRGLLPAKLQPISNEAFFQAVGDAATDGGYDLDDANVRGVGGNTGSLHVRATFHDVTAAVKVGDYTELGIALSHSLTGEFATEVQFFGFRLWCKNGATSPVCETKDGKTRKLRIRRGGDSGGTRTVDAVRDRARRAFRQLKDRRDAMMRLNVDRIDLASAVETLVKEQRLSEAVQRELLEARGRNEHGGFETRYGLVNLLSWVGTHGPFDKKNRLPQTVRDRLQAMAGVLSWRDAHICEKCQRVFAPSLN